MNFVRQQLFKLLKIVCFFCQNFEIGFFCRNIFKYGTQGQFFFKLRPEAEEKFIYIACGRLTNAKVAAESYLMCGTCNMLWLTSMLGCTFLITQCDLFKPLPPAAIAVSPPDQSVTPRVLES